MWWQDFDRRRSLWREMDRLRREANRLMRSGPTVSAPAFPALNVWSGAESVVVTAEIPGVEPDDIDISVVDKTLTLNGSLEREGADEDVRYHRRERGYGQFSRTLQLPYRIQADAVEATFDKGVLQIRLPRAEADRPKKISVKAA